MNAHLCHSHPIPRIPSPIEEKHMEGIYEGPK